jgi:hypothetical protein
MSYITPSNAKVLQKRSWASRKANSELRGLLLPLGLWDSANGAPYTRRMRSLLGLDYAGRRLKLSIFAGQHWEAIQMAIRTALNGQNAQHSMWACEILCDLEEQLARQSAHGQRSTVC